MTQGFNKNRQQTEVSAEYPRVITRITMTSIKLNNVGQFEHEPKASRYFPQ